MVEHLPLIGLGVVVRLSRLRQLGKSNTVLVGSTALSYAQVMARTNNAGTFKKDYAAYVWLLRKLADECGIPKTLDKTGNGIKTHLWVTNNLSAIQTILIRMLI